MRPGATRDGPQNLVTLLWQDQAPRRAASRSGPCPEGRPLPSPAHCHAALLEPAVLSGPFPPSVSASEASASTLALPTSALAAAPNWLSDPGCPCRRSGSNSTSSTRSHVVRSPTNILNLVTRPILHLPIFLDRRLSLCLLLPSFLCVCLLRTPTSTLENQTVDRTIWGKS